MTEDAVQSPCINVCELGKDDVCKGCYRSMEEIAAWGYATTDERVRIVSNTRQRQIIANNG